MNENISFIPNRLKNAAVGGHVAGASDIIDDVKGQTQDVINAANDAKFSQMDDEIEALVDQDVVPVDSLPSYSTADPKKIYRVVGSTSYTDYMVNATGDGWKKLATLDFPGIDDDPTTGSDNLVKSGGVHNSLMQYSHALSTDDIEVGSVVDRYTVIKRFEGGFKAGRRCILKLTDGWYEGDASCAMELVIRDPLGTALATIKSGYFDEYVAECCLTEYVEYLEVATHAKGITDLRGNVFACIPNVDKNHSDSALFLENPLECYADCIKELYLKDFDPEQDYYLYVRKVMQSATEGNVYVQITKELVETPLSSDLVAEATFTVSDPSRKIANFAPKGGNGIGGTCVLFRESIDGTGYNPFLTHGHKIKNSVVSDLSNFPICKLYSEGIAMSFTGLREDLDYYLRVAVAGDFGIRYIQLATSASVGSENLVAQGIVEESGMQTLAPMHSSGISGMVYLPSTDEIAPFKIDKQAATGDDSWRIQVEKLWGAVSKEFVVNKSSASSDKYSSLLECIIEAVKTKNSTVYVEEGEYDLIQEFKDKYGDNFVTDYTIGNSPYGIVLKNGVHVIFSPKAKVTAALPDWEEDEDPHIQDARTDFSPFNSGAGGFTLEGITLEATNCRYCVHDDRGNRKDGTQGTDFYTNRYINCNMVLDNRNSHVNQPTDPYWQPGYTQVIGGGFGTNGVIEIKDCVFESVRDDSNTFPIVSWHNSLIDDEYAKSRIYLSGNYFKGKGQFRFSSYGTSTIKSEAIVEGNSFGDSINQIHENPTEGGVDNIEVIEWNNTVR